MKDRSFAAGIAALLVLLMSAPVLAHGDHPPVKPPAQPAPKPCVPCINGEGNCGVFC